ncbi:phospholipase D-like domain-containing protein [Candidatus Cardinium hertigii]|uniref:phospholipase D n=1 Tax=Candidatus Cardinium hertigii TaxID=247481 RepID=A0A3N2QC54_9BACT|nr:phospholipase D-like domain-containing protein [Candidatus Cardinium hertigii]ROT47387.1 hypothetical protein EDM02_03050 [Candidatus Cardinium hertigii]
MKIYKIPTWARLTHMQLTFSGAIIMAMGSVWVHYTACQSSLKSYNATDTDIDIEMYFTPEDPCMDLIIKKILSAKKRILVQAYVITSEKIARALIQAHQKKIKVQLLVDKNTQSSKGSKIDLMLQYGIPIIIDTPSPFGIAHSKTMIIDDTYVITGSFNWTDGAQFKNSETVVIIKGKDSNRKFKNNWYKRAKSGKKLKSIR